MVSITIFDDLFSQRKKSTKTSTLTRSIPKKARNQVLYSIRENSIRDDTLRLDEIRRLGYLVRKNKGVVKLSNENINDFEKDLLAYLQMCKDDDFLDTIEIFLKVKMEAISIFSTNPYYFPNPAFEASHKTRNTFITEFNKIMELNDIAYRIKDFQIIAIDSELQYKQLIEPTLSLLSEERFKLANEEFIKALKKFREKDNEGAIREANNAFESTMKVITGRSSGEATQLLQECKRRGIIPPEYEKIGLYLHKLFQTLPTMRDNLSDAHGQGEEKRTIPLRDALLALNLAATFISYIASHEKQ